MRRFEHPLRLDDLPVFATDRQIAEAIVGKDSAEKWMRERLPTLAQKPGFPAIDPFHDGRPVALVRLFYANYLNLPSDGRGLPDANEQEGQWKRSRRPA
jgi:hypothetical protein